MIIVDTKLKEREAQGNPIQVGIIGAGEMSAGLINQIERYVPGMRVACVYNRTLEKAQRAYQTAGVSEVSVLTSANSLDDCIGSGTASVTDDPGVILGAGRIDVVVEMTGTIQFSFDLIIQSFAAGKSVVSFNAELDATVGPYLQLKAREAGVRYTLGDGDQPGVTLNLMRFVQGMGFKPQVLGNIKGMLDHYRTPETQKGFAEKSGMSVDMVTSFADGTKVSLEQACIANATGFRVAKRGMISIDYTGHVDDLTGRYDFDDLQANGGIVEMVIGGKPGPGVFVFASTDDPVSARFLNYGKLGDGPLYSFYIPYHLLFFELPSSIARLVDFQDGTLDALDSLSVEVIATAKQDLKAGDTLDGIGGFAVYGECENHSIVQSDGLLPVALSKGRTLAKDVPKDAAIAWSDLKPELSGSVESAYRAIIA
ncbi:NAD(P)H-dependent oxidoreductase [Coraliomargarita parva]|uniref:NAD(P)H-dependent oxidoreductase n=1 Tax=Coraliomargarita parva TaxID=3014050 RepID=UPI0022B3BD2D|nr:SAF domain-containing protein [Coraliomargarita parva]